MRLSSVGRPGTASRQSRIVAPAVLRHARCATVSASQAPDSKPAVYSQGCTARARIICAGTREISSTSCKRSCRHTVRVLRCRPGTTSAIRDALPHSDLQTIHLYEGGMARTLHRGTTGHRSKAAALCTEKLQAISMTHRRFGGVGFKLWAQRLPARARGGTTATQICRALMISTRHACLIVHKLQKSHSNHRPGGTALALCADCTSVAPVLVTDCSIKSVDSAAHTLSFEMRLSERARGLVYGKTATDGNITQPGHGPARAKRASCSRNTSILIPAPGACTAAGGRCTFIIHAGPTRSWCKCPAPRAPLAVTRSTHLRSRPWLSTFVAS